MASKYKFLALLSVLSMIAAPLTLAEQPDTRVASVLSKKQAAALESTASTSEDHMTLAVYYQAQARKFDEKSRYHQEMADWYRQRPLPYDGKMPVPMQRHCKEWASRFAQQGERAAVLARVHQEKALGPETVISFEQLKGSELRNTGFTAINTNPRLIEQPTPAQTSLFRETLSASNRFYDRARILTYVVRAKGQSLIDIRELRQSAEALFGRQQEFLQSLNGEQKAAVELNLRDMENARRDIENALTRLEQAATSPSNKSYFNSAKKIKESLEKWHRSGQQIGIALALNGGA